MGKTRTSYGKGWAGFCRWLLRRMGWTVLGGPVPEKKAIILGVPHTSIWDFPIAYLCYTGFGDVAHVMVKKELFFWPLGSILRACGCIPVNRSDASELVRSLISHINNDEVFKLAIAPEGTRKPVRRWKTGAFRIAYATGVPVYAGWFDWRTKRISCGEKLVLSGDISADMAMMQAHYENMHLTGKHKDQYITH
ncbi:MAG: 1-acyl-sn-glycerol-3-phosphate acyltransferase [Bacteroidales bacterium]|nr:1-acyl-sn-glycerol-3-phosphate acyltransferase [Bacteroidales bacterium]